MGGAPVLGGPHLTGKRANQPSDGVGWGGALERRFERAERMGEDVCPSFWVANGATKKKKIERAMGPRISMALLNCETQQPTESRPHRWSIFGRGGAHGEDDLGGRRHSFSAFRLWGKKINKMRFVMALEGRQSTIPHDNQPNKCGNDGG